MQIKWLKHRIRYRLYICGSIGGDVTPEVVHIFRNLALELNKYGEHAASQAERCPKSLDQSSSVPVIRPQNEISQTTERAFMLHQCRNAVCVTVPTLGGRVWGPGVGRVQCTEQGLLQWSGRWSGGSSPRGHGGLGQQEGNGSVPECWVPCGEGNLPGALSLRYRSSDTFPFAAGSSSSLRFCLWKKPSWEEGQMDRSEGQTFKKCEWLKKKAIIVTIVKFIFTTSISCVLVIFSPTLGGSKASQYRTAQSSLPNL